jgi:hypothetical protein
MRLLDAISQSPEPGAPAQLRAATDVAQPSGTYLGPGSPGGSSRPAGPVAAPARARDRNRASTTRPWALSEELTGTAYARI